ncbi:MAG: hypothetical protein HZB38_05400 [Planctomycetes bacterium]|nr:hypothetical protein [Planctomycetota bacterium]
MKLSFRRVAIRIGLLGLLGAVPAGAQDKAGDIERMVRDGMAEALESRFAGGRTPEEQGLLAEAYANKAVRVSEDRARHAAFQEAARRYERWIKSLGSAEMEKEERCVELATTRCAFGGMILSRWIEADFSQFELTDGRKANCERLTETLTRARSLYEQALSDLAPLISKDAGRDDEDRLLVLGILDRVGPLSTDARFNLAWTNLFLAQVGANDKENAAKVRAEAESGFRALLGAGQEGEAEVRCLLGHGIALRELDKLDESARALSEAARSAGGPLGTQVTYALARTQIQAGQYEAARKTLKPLVETDLDALPRGQEPARFYLNLARLWDANSYLLESQSKQASAEEAARLREEGMTRFGALLRLGGRWNEVVPLFAQINTDAGADIRRLSVSELLLSAQQLINERKHRQALLRLREAAGRPKLSTEIEPLIWLQIGQCEYESGNAEQAADAFELVAKRFPAHSRAAAMIDAAFQLRAKTAEESHKPEDYRKLAETLKLLLTGFPKHEKCAEAQWWLPVALQAAGDNAAAIEQFKKILKTSSHWDEAQFRAVMCRRVQFETERATLPADELRSRGAALAREMLAYADAAMKRGGDKPGGELVKRSATAVVSAAELCSGQGVEDHAAALNFVRDFEQRFPDSDLIGRVLAVRIAAYRSQRQFEAAAKVVEQYLQTVPPGQAGGVLAMMAAGMQEEVDRLLSSGREDDARRLAGESVKTFEQLDEWTKADASRTGHAAAVRFGLARMRQLAGEPDAALAIARELLASDPRDGRYQRLLAQILTSRLSADSPAAECEAARQAWETLLRDGGLRAAAPEAYWEARYHFLSLLMREGRAAEVEAAIRQEKLWSKDFGGTWRARFDDLYAKAAPSSRPSSDRAP